MSEQDNGQDKPKKKSKGLIVKALGGVILVGAGAGGTYGLVEAGMLAGGAHKTGKEDNNPKLILKGQDDPFALKSKDSEEGTQDIPGDGGSKYRTAYYTFSDEFTSNLRNSAGLIQLSLAASTHRDGRVLMWLRKHELAIRSKILIELADTPEEDVLTQAGKEALQKRLTKAINEVLTEAEGFGGVDNVYFRSLLVQ